MNDRRIHYRSVAQHQSTVTQITVDNLQNSTRQLMFLQQAAEVEDRGFVRNSIQMQPGKLAQDRRFIQRLLHRRIAVARSEEHTSELQSRGHLVCRLLLEKKNK